MISFLGIAGECSLHGYPGCMAQPVHHQIPLTPAVLINGLNAKKRCIVKIFIPRQGCLAFQCSKHLSTHVFSLMRCYKDHDTAVLISMTGKPKIGCFYFLSESPDFKTIDLVSNALSRLRLRLLFPCLSKLIVIFAFYST